MIGGLERDALRRHREELARPPLEPGDILTVAIRNIRERDRTPERRVQKAAERWRPAVYLRHDDEREAIMVIGLTAKPRFSTGDPRVALEGWRETGLNTPGWIYSARPAFVPLEDIGVKVGHLCELDAKAVARAIIAQFGDHPHVRAMVYPLMPEASR